MITYQPTFWEKWADVAAAMLHNRGDALAARLDELAAPLGVTGADLMTAFVRELRDYLGGELGAEAALRIEARAERQARGLPDLTGTH